jgi:hypothetical protein
MFREFFIMLRKVGFAVLVVLLVGSPCFGQEWARKMFKVSQHDFGSVASGAKAEYEFEFENIYLEDIHVSFAYASCGCTSVKVETPLLKTYEKGKILAHFNTDTFRGQRGATLTVVIDQPFYAEVQLHVKGYIRGDVVVNPGSVQLGTLDQGTQADKVVAVSYAGRNNWQIVDVKSSNPNITAKAVETGRNYGQVSYNVQVHLDKNVSPGYVSDQLVLVTNDASASQIPVRVEGLVQSAGITVSPPTLFMGVIQPGEKVTKQLVVKSKKPFRILGITCDDPSFQFDTSKANAAKELHLIPVTFSAGTDTGKLVKIKIKTEQGEMTPELETYAYVGAEK